MCYYLLLFKCCFLKLIFKKTSIYLLIHPLSLSLSLSDLDCWNWTELHIFSGLCPPLLTLKLLKKVYLCGQHAEEEKLQRPVTLSMYIMDIWELFFKTSEMSTRDIRDNLTDINGITKMEETFFNLLRKIYSHITHHYLTSFVLWCSLMMLETGGRNPAGRNVVWRRAGKGLTSLML